MSEKLTTVMHVTAMGELTPSDIGGEACDGCRNNKSCGAAVLIKGVTKQATAMLFGNCEIVPVGTLKRIKELEGALHRVERKINSAKTACEYKGVVWREFTEAQEWAIDALKGADHE